MKIDKTLEQVLNQAVAKFKNGNDAVAWIKKNHPEVDWRSIGDWWEKARAEFEVKRTAFEKQSAWRSWLLSQWRDDEKTLGDVIERVNREREANGPHAR